MIYLLHEFTHSADGPWRFIIISRMFFSQVLHKRDACLLRVLIPNILKSMQFHRHVDQRFRISRMYSQFHSLYLYRVFNYPAKLPHQPIALKFVYIHNNELAIWDTGTSPTAAAGCSCANDEEVPVAAASNRCLAGGNGVEIGAVVPFSLLADACGCC